MLIFLTSYLELSSSPVPNKELPTDAELKQLAFEMLRTVVGTNREQPRMHAAEDLILLGYADPFATIPDGLRPLTADSPIRIVSWRVQAREAAAAGRGANQWLRSIVNVFLTTPDAPDQVDAAETLCKLRYQVSEIERAEFKRVARGNNPIAVESCWVLANGGGEKEEKALTSFLRDPQPALRATAAYSIHFGPQIRPATHDLLIACAEKEPETSTGRAYIFSSALVHAKIEDGPGFIRVVESYIDKDNLGEKFEGMNCLAMVGDGRELKPLGTYLQPSTRYDGASADLNVGAANAILNILKRQQLRPE